MANQTQQAIFAGGCFWCTEAVFKNLKGVISVTPGYAGGSVENPTYEQVSAGKTGHAEAIKIAFNLHEIKYPDLLHVFFATHDPTTLNQQGNDAGTQYRSAIFYTNDEQRQEAEREVRELESSKTFKSPILTELLPLDKFYEAEAYHKNYYARNPEATYCQVVIDPKIAKLRQKFSHLLIIIAALIFLGAGCTNPENKVNTVSSDKEIESAPAAIQASRLDFSQYASPYRFSAELPAGLAVEYVPEIQSINIHDGEQSQIFIRFFEANTFLTLSTVNILEREETQVRGHAAVRYEIEKKPGTADFPRQPTWRNKRHKLVDIRYRSGSPSYFYVFSYNPQYPKEQFESFIQSLRFHNDADSFIEPLARAGERVAKKPFGIFITPETSPVSPEKFRGFHTGTDFEILEGEAGVGVPVKAICGGAIIAKRAVGGYGGLLAQTCERAGKNLYIIYGHLALASISHNIGDYLASGAEIGLLGEAGPDTDNERQHLHLGVYTGAKLDISGYAATAGALDNWIDAETLF